MRSLEPLERSLRPGPGAAHRAVRPERRPPEQPGARAAPEPRPPASVIADARTRTHSPHTRVPPARAPSGAPRAAARPAPPCPCIVRVRGRTHSPHIRMLPTHRAPEPRMHAFPQPSASASRASARAPTPHTHPCYLHAHRAVHSARRPEPRLRAPSRSTVSQCTARVPARAHPPHTPACSAACDGMAGLEQGAQGSRAGVTGFASAGTSQGRQRALLLTAQ